MKRFFLYCMTGAVLALAGCNGNGGSGGGGGGSMTTPPPMPPPSPNPVSLSDLFMDYMTVPAGIYRVTAGMTRDVGHATFSCPAGGATCVVTVAADGRVTSAGGRATAMPSPAARTAKMAADEAARQAAAAAQRETDALIMASKSGDLPYPTRSRRTGEDWPIPPYLAVTTPDNWDASFPLTGIALGRDAQRRNGFWDVNNKANLGSDLGDTLGQDDGHLANESEFLKKERDLPPLGQFTGEVHTRTVKDGTVTTTDEIMLYHDKKEPGLVPYSVYYGAQSRYDWRWDASGRGVGGYRRGNPSAQSGNFFSNNRKIGVSGVTWGTNTTGPATENGRLTIHNTRALSAEETALFASPDFPSTIPSQIFTYGTGAGQRTLPFDGTFYNGAIAGKYNCTGGACTIARDSKGETLRFSGTWTFTPTAPAHEIMLPVDHDADYLVFGYWVETKTGQAPVIRTLVSGSASFGEEDIPFSGAHRVVNSAIAGLTGTATYNGRAFGRYGRHEVNPDGSVASGSQATGLFTAKTTLTAQFGDNTSEVAPNDQFAITGRVTNFKPFQTTTGPDLSDWTVDLQKARFRNGGEYSNTFPISRTSDPATRPKAPTQGMTGTTPGATPGNWVGRFFGPTGAHPTGVTGAFDANFTNGNVRGAFGATRPE